MRRTLLRALTVLVATAALLLAGCDDQITAPNSDEAQSPSQATANAGPAAPGGKCDVTVSHNESIDDKIDNTAQSGDVVCVESGTYTEQVTINKDVSLRGLNNPTIEVPADPTKFTIPESGPTWEPIIFAFGGNVDPNGYVSGDGTVNVTVKGFTIDGKGQQPEAARLPAIFYRNASGIVSKNTINNMDIGGKATFGILVYGDSEVDILNNDINGYERGGIGANGDGGAHPSPMVKIASNEVTGSTGIAEAWGPNGIQVGYGTEGKIHDNIVKDNRYSKSSGTASCILVFESNNVSVKRNTVSNCDVGIGIGTWGWFGKTAEANQVVKNDVSNALFGASLNAIAYAGLTGTNPSLKNNKVVNNSFDGGSIGITGVRIWEVDASPDFDPSATNNKLIGNQITDFETAVDNGGSETKVQANDRPIAP